MPLPSLATQADATTYGYSLPAASADALLARASARVRRAAGQPISETTSTVRLPVDHGTVDLPGGPVTAVTSVTMVAADGTTTVLDTDEWLLDGARITLLVYRDELQADVAYTRGWATIPDGIAELVCQVASRMAQTPDGAEGLLRQRSIDDYSETFATEQIVAAGDLLPGELTALRSELGQPAAWVVGT